MANKTVTFTVRVDDNGTMRKVEVDAKDLQGALSGVGKSAQAASGGLGNITKYLSKFASVTAVIGVLKNATETIAQFERANSELASVLGTTIDGVNSLAESAKVLGRTTEFTASEVTELQTSLARLGFNGNQITSMQESVLKFASAVGTDLGSAADFAGSALRAFGLNASDSQKLLDIMAASTSKSALSFSKLQESISTVGPVANAFGLKAEEVTALLGVLSNSGFDASSAATALRNILLNLADSNGKLATGLGHTAKTMPEIIAALKELRDKGVDLNSTLEMTDKRSVAAFAALVAGADDVDELNIALHNADGSLEQMYETMTNNVIGAVHNVQSAWEGLMLAFQSSSGPIKWVTQQLANALNYATYLISGDKFGADVDMTIKQNKEAGTGSYDDYVQGIELAKRKLAELKEQEVNYAEESAFAIQQHTRAVQKAERDLAILEAAKDKLYSDVDLTIGPQLNTQGTLTPPEPLFPTGSSGGMSEDINNYRLAVQRAVEINHAFAGSKSDIVVQLAAMKSGISSLIAKYGAENDEVKSLIKEYGKLNASRLNFDSPLQKGDQSALQGKATTSSPVQLAKTSTAAKQLTSDVKDSTTAINALAGAFGSLGQVVSGTSGSWIEWAGNLLRAVAQAIPAITTLSAALKQKTAAETADAIAGGASAVASTPIVGPGLAVAAGATILASVMAAISSIPKFANGGIAYGPTLGLFGEYTGAVNNPEVVAPLSRLRELIAPASGGTRQIEFKIKNRTLYAAIATENNIKQRG